MSRVDTESEIFATFLDNLSELTDRNQHGEARLQIADYFFGPKSGFYKIFNLIDTITQVENHTPQSLMKYREEKLAEMLKFIERNEGKDVAELVNSIL